MNQTDFVLRYGPFFEATAKNTAIHPMALVGIAHVITGQNTALLKANNFFGIQRNGQYKKFATPFDGIQNGIEILTNNPKFSSLKIGTLKANPKKQIERLLLLLDLA
jgi:hypothetical protein